MRLSHGKYSGMELHEIKDLGYLKWLEEQSWISQRLREDLQFEIKRREGDASSLGRVVKK